MEPDRKGASRREFIAFVGGTAAMIPLVNLIGCSDESSGPTRSGAPGGAAPQAETQTRAATSPPAASGSGPATVPASLPRLAEDDPAALALGYRQDATKVDTTKFPRRAGPEGAQQFCHSCALFLGKEGQQWAGCLIFVGKAVNYNGWCNAWAPKA